MADNNIQEKIDRLLDRVKDTGSGLTLAQLGLVKKVRFNENQRKLTLFLEGISSQKACCAAMNLAILGDVETRLKDEFKKEFPGFEILLANA